MVKVLTQVAVTTVACCFLLHVNTSSGFLPSRRHSHKRSFFHFRAERLWDAEPSFAVPPHELLQRIDAILGKSAVADTNNQPILDQVDMEHAMDAQACEILNSADCEFSQSVNQNLRNNSKSSLEWIDTGRRLALETRTKPLLNESSIALLRNVATEFWSNCLDTTNTNTPQQNRTSRFTYQRKGNQEAHLEDLCRYNETLKQVIQETLHSKIYPIMKEYFLHNDDDHDHNDPDLVPCVYDSLFIRYNATAAENSKLGAGQPLHRDLGLVSVNIMLNSKSDFQGGGTLFEDQLGSTTSDSDSDSSSETSHNSIHPLLPADGPGHGIFHYSHQRHAGAGTINGVRDILVLFLTATSHLKGQAPSRERAARIKTMASKVSSVSSVSSDSPLEKAKLYRLVLELVPDDGEAWHYLGMALHNSATNGFAAGQDQSEQGSTRSMSTLAAAALWQASKLNPNDARVLNNLGLVLKRKSDLDLLEDNDDNNDLFANIEIEQAYEKSVQIHQRSKRLGCNVEQDLDATCLNYGLWLANQDRFEQAVDILAQVGCPTGTPDDIGTSRVKSDAYKLWAFCQRQVTSLANAA
jgi:tetratricopeptide (TPR) repeat protein